MVLEVSDVEKLHFKTLGVLFTVSVWFGGFLVRLHTSQIQARSFTLSLGILVSSENLRIPPARREQR